MVRAAGKGSEAGIVECRTRQRYRGRIELLRADRDPRALCRQPLIHDPAIERSLLALRAAVAAIAQHHDAIAPYPFVQDREIADRQRVGGTLGLASREDDDGAIAAQVLASEVRIELTVLDAISGRIPRGGGYRVEYRQYYPHLARQ